MSLETSVFDPRKGGRSTIVLLCFATLAIANSHLENLYPLPWLAADGLLGNSLFFFLAGFGLAKSELNEHRSFISYYRRRVWRIYPSLWLVMLSLEVGLKGEWRNWTFVDYFNRLIYPTDYGFVTLIMVFYVPFYFLVSLRSAKWLLYAALALLLPYLGVCGQILRAEKLQALQLGALDDRLWWVFFFQIMLAGGYVGLRAKQQTASIVTGRLVLLGAVFALYLGLKLAMVKSVRVPGTEISSANFFFVLHLLTLVVILLMFDVLSAESFRRRIFASAPVQWLINLVGAMTLEIYLCHIFIARNDWIESLPFPANVLLFYVVTVIVSAFFLWLADGLRKSVQSVLSPARRRAPGD